MMMGGSWSTPGDRWGFDMRKGYNWKEIWTRKFWRMWGVKRTLLYMVRDTLVSLPLPGRRL